MKSKYLDKVMIKKYDGVLICTDHDNVNYDLVYQNAKIILTQKCVQKFSQK